MSKVSAYGVTYGDITASTAQEALRVQEGFGRCGRYIAIRPGFADENGRIPRVWNGLAFPAELLPGLIAALQAAKRHSDELKVAETAALNPPAANDPEGGGDV